MSSSTLPPPLSLRDCYVDGSLDVIRYFAFSRKRRQTNHSRVLLQSIIDKRRCRNNKPVETVLIKSQHYRSVHIMNHLLGGHQATALVLIRQTLHYYYWEL